MNNISIPFIWGENLMKLYVVCCIVVLGIFIYGGQGQECVIKETFNEIKHEMNDVQQQDKQDKIEGLLNSNTFNL